MTMKKKTGEY